ncbi:MAG: hypothetical protein GY869_18365, partial [Planctomycetes bacterium]|nr:hypothetical protein [Planctomycetota bacterium]
DSYGNVMVIGDYQGTMDFNPTAATDMHTPNRNSDIYFCRLAPPYSITAGLTGYKTVKYTDPDGSLVSVKVGKGSADLYFNGSSLDKLIKGKTATIIGDATLKKIDLVSSNIKTSVKLNAKGGADGQATLGGITGEDLGKLTAKTFDLVGNINLTGSLSGLTLDDIDPNVSITTQKPSAKGLNLKADQIYPGVTFSLADSIKGFKVNGDLDDVVICTRNNIKKLATKGGIIDSYILAGYDQNTGGMQGLNNGNIGGITAKGAFIRSYISAGVLPPSSELPNVLPGVQPPYTSLGYTGYIGNVKFGAIDQNANADFGLWAATEIKSVKAGNIKFIDSAPSLHFMVEDNLG